MNQELKQHLDLIKTALDKGVQAGVYNNLETTYSVSIAFNKIYEELKNIHGGGE